MAIRANQLTRIQARQLEDWIVKHKSEIFEKKWSYKEAARIFSASSNFAVTDRNVLGAAKVMGIIWPANGPMLGPRKEHQIYKILVEELLALRAELGGQPSKRLQELHEALS